MVVELECDCSYIKMHSHTLACPVVWFSLFMQRWLENIQFNSSLMCEVMLKMRAGDTDASKACTGETLLSLGHRAGAQVTAAMRGSFTWSRSAGFRASRANQSCLRGGE